MSVHSHPSTHEHRGKTCPVTGQSHDFCPAQKGDSRSACPALNTMANHGYTARDGKNLSPQDLIKGLKECYRLSAPLAYALAYGGFLVLGKLFKRAQLFEISRHNIIEHNASLVHNDTPEGEQFAPIEIGAELVEALCADVNPTAKECEKVGARWLMNHEDVARARVRREKDCGPVDSLHKFIAAGEMAIVLGMWETRTETKVGIPMEYLTPWMSEERLPEGWKPNHTEGIWDVLKRIKTIKAVMAKLREAEAAEAREN